MKFDPLLKKCPLCDSTSISLKYNIIQSHSFNVYECQSCLFIFMNPAFSDTFIASLYSDDYYSGKADYSYIDERDNHKFNSYVWKARIKKIHKYKKSGTFLDIGCSFGGLLSSAQKYYDVYGVDISDFASKYCESINMKIHKGTLNDAPFKENSFDVITMIELIEHIKDPVNFIKKTASILKPGGLCVIQTADMGAFQAVSQAQNYHYFLPGHLSYFTACNLSSLLTKSGFTNIKIYRPVDFGLIPKLRKSRGQFKSFKDYKRWLTIAKYHFLGYFKKKGRPMTSSMVIYAFKK